VIKLINIIHDNSELVRLPLCTRMITCSTIPLLTHAAVRLRHFSEPLPSFKQGNSVLDDRGSIPHQDSCPDLLIVTQYCYRFWGEK
jgi:hypothetical protein